MEEGYYWMKGPYTGWQWLPVKVEASAKSRLYYAYLNRNGPPIELFPDVIAGHEFQKLVPPP